MTEKNWTALQEKIIDISSGKHLVLAPPGSGKTDILAERIKRTLERGEKSSAMLCVTFTNRAARNMVQRAAKLTDKPPFIGTLHTFGYRHLIANRVVPASTILLDEEDAGQLLDDSCEIYIESVALDNGKKRSVEKPKKDDLMRILKIVNEENHGLRSQSNVEEQELVLRSIAKVYTEQKEKLNAIDFDDILIKMLQSLRAGVSKKMCGYKWVQADEVQDLNPMQWEIIEALSDPDSSQVYFGDLDQSIFSFMGASGEALGKHTSTATKHYLEENFRSPKELLELFNLYASNNLPSRESNVLKFPDRGGNDCPAVVEVLRSHGSLIDEAEDIVSAQLESCLKKYTTTALLVRTNADANVISDRLTNYGVDHFRVSGFDLFSRRCIKDVMAFLRVWSAPEDRVSWVRLFKEFGRVESLRVARDAINEIFDAGLNPMDWLLLDGGGNMLDNFSLQISNDRCVVFDTETTGTNWFEDDIIQIAAIELERGEPTGKVVELYFSTNKDLTASSEIHNITPEVLMQKSVPKTQGLKSFIEFIDGARLVGHNVNFDIQMLFYNCMREGIEWKIPDTCIDTLTLARRLYPKLMNHKLGFLLEALNIEGENSHNALDDVRATVNLAARFKNDADRTSDLRDTVVKKHSKRIDRFGRDLSPMWRKIKENLHVETSIGKVILGFFRNAELLGYRIDDDERRIIEKCIRGLDRIEKSSGVHQISMGEIFQTRVREVMSFSEADLITADDKVVVSTVHKAKGLEFDCVIILGCVDGIYPHFYSKMPSQIEEDARLLYVAMTRAKKALYFSTHDRASVRGRDYERHPSRFIKFLDA